MGVHKFAPIPAATGRGVGLCRECWSVCIMRLWNRLLRMDDNGGAKRCLNVTCIKVDDGQVTCMIYMWDWVVGMF